MNFFLDSSSLWIVNSKQQKQQPWPFLDLDFSSKLPKAWWFLYLALATSQSRSQARRRVSRRGRKEEQKVPSSSFLRRKKNERDETKSLTRKWKRVAEASVRVCLHEEGEDSNKHKLVSEVWSKYRGGWIFNCFLQNRKILGNYILKQSLSCPHWSQQQLFPFQDLAGKKMGRRLRRRRFPRNASLFFFVLPVKEIFLMSIGFVTNCLFSANIFKE